MLCMGQVIEKSFHNKYGENWFLELKNISVAEAKRSGSLQKPVIDNNWTSIDELDFAALVKVFVYLEDALRIITHHYGIDFRRNALRNAARELMKYRNNTAHFKLGNIRAGRQQVADVDSNNTEFAMNDMLSFAGYFKSEKSSGGKSYYYIMYEFLDKYVHREDMPDHISNDNRSHENNDNVNKKDNYIVQNNPDNAPKIYINNFAQPNLKKNNGAQGYFNAYQQPSNQTNKKDYKYSSYYVQPNVTVNKTVNTYGDNNLSVKNKKVKKQVVIAVCALFIFIVAACLIVASVFQNAQNTFSPANAYTQNHSVSAQTESQTITSAPSTTKPESISGSVEIDGLVLSIGKVSGNTITINYENAGNSFSLGWVSGSDVIAETTQGECYSYIKRSVKIRPGDSGSFRVSFDDLSGDLTKITIENVYILGDSGLPDTGSGDSGGETVVITVN